MLKDRFSTREILELTGVTARQLQWWDERGIVVPQRQGRNRTYSASDLIDIAVIEQLRQRRVSLAQVRRVLRFLRTELRLQLADMVSGRRKFHLLLDTKRVFLKTESRQIIDLLQNTKQPMLLICLTEALKPLRIELRNLLKMQPARRPIEPATRRTIERRATA